MFDNSKTYLLYDDTCGFCDYTVKFVLKHEKEVENKIIFAALQSNFGSETIKKFHLENVDSVIIIKNGNAYTKSKAILKLTEHLKFPYSVLKIFSFIPQIISDKVYDLIAKHRKKIMGEVTSCDLPSPENRKRFIT